MTAGSTGIDYSIQISPQLTVTDGVVSGSTLSSATGGFTPQMIGNAVTISNDSSNRYFIVAYTNANTVTLDRAGVNGSGLTVYVGGACSSFDTIVNASVAGNHIYVKYSSTPYTTAGNIAYNKGASSTGSRIRLWLLKGYNDSSERNPFSKASARPTIQRTSAVPFSSSSPTANHLFVDLVFDGNNQAANFFFYTSGSQSTAFIRCKFDKIVNGYCVGYYYTLLECEAYVNGTSALGATVFILTNAIGCYVESSVGTGHLFFDRNYTCVNNVARSAGTVTGYGFRASGYPVLNCTAINAYYGFYGYQQGAVFLGCMASGCTYGYSADADARTWLVSCGAYQCATNYVSGRVTTDAIVNRNWAASGLILPTTNPFMGGMDFSPNMDPTGGALLRGAGYPPKIAGTLTYVYPDVGVSGHPDPVVNAWRLIVKGRSG